MRLQLITHVGLAADGHVSQDRVTALDLRAGQISLAGSAAGHGPAVVIHVCRLANHLVPSHQFAQVVRACRRIAGCALPAWTAMPFCFRGVDTLEANAHTAAIKSIAINRSRH